MTAAPLPEVGDATGGTDRVVINGLSRIGSVVHFGNDMIVTMTHGSFRVGNHFTGGNTEFVSDPSRSVVLATGTIGGAASGIIAGTGKGDVLGLENTQAARPVYPRVAARWLDNVLGDLPGQLPSSLSRNSDTALAWASKPS